MNFIDLVNHLDRSIIVTDDSLSIQFLNSFAKNELNAHNHIWENKVLMNFITLRQPDKELLDSTISDGISVKIPVFIENEHRPHEVIEKQMTCKGFSDEKSKAPLFLFEIDEAITSRIEIEKVQNLGYLTGNLAHALSNPLAVIQINCDSLEIECKKSSNIESQSVQSKVSRIGTALDRVTEENQKLKDLSRKLSTADEGTLDSIIPYKNNEKNH